MSELVKLCKILAGSSGERNSPHVPLKERLFLEGRADALAPTPILFIAEKRLPLQIYSEKLTN